MRMKIFGICCAFVVVLLGVAEAYNITCKGGCGPGEKCVLQQVHCPAPPCPPLPVCVNDPCAAMLCMWGFKCIELPTGHAKCVATCQIIDCQPCIDTPTGGKCVPPTCEVTGCPKGEKCVPSPISGYRCVSTCQIRKCAEHQICRDTNIGAECIDAKSCEDVQCNPGRRCVESLFGSIKCVDSCELKECKAGYKCVETAFGAHCVMKTCADLLCKPYERCVQKATGPECVGTCALVRCPNCIETDDGPKCVPFTCATMECPKGKTCVGGRTTVICKKPPCIQPLPKCVPICKAPKDPGPCKGSFPRYHYNKETRQCERFIYGGCGGNDNRFSSKKECEKACPVPPRTCNDITCPRGKKCIQALIKCAIGPCPRPPPKCVPACKGGMVWSDCGSPCTVTCSREETKCLHVYGCIPKCHCPPNKPIWHQGRCISAGRCPVCKGGQVWKNCGSPCTKTCLNPNPTCIEKCEARCECPDSKPLWHNGSCISYEGCKIY